MYPSFFPPDCPPASAAAPKGLFYRFVKKLPGEAAALTSHRERLPDADFDNECHACGLSVYKNRDELAEFRKYGGGFRKMTIASIVLDGAPGLLAKTKSRSHHTWWLPQEADRTPLAALLKNAEKSSTRSQ